MNEHERLIFLTKRFYKLQNLRFAPAWILFLVWPWIISGRLRTGEVALAVFLGFSISWYWVLGRYYVRRFGKMETSPVYEKSYWITVAGLFIVIPLMFYFVGLVASNPRLGMQVNSIFWLLVIQVVVLTEALSSCNIFLRRFYYLAASVLLLLAFISAVFSRVPGHLFFVAFAFTFGAAVMLALGVFDHLLLIRLLRPTQREIHA